MNPANLNIETIRDVPCGGQCVAAYPVKVRVTHIPTGLVAICHSEMSQYRNRNVAMAMIEYGLAEIGWKE